MKTRHFAIAGVASLIAIPGLGWAAGLINVDQKGLAFSTPVLTVQKGDIVNFTNSDNTSHNILVSGNGITLNSGLQQPGVTFKAPLMKQGAYQVSCGIHPKMRMTIVVR
jgi:plastocyanin